MRADRGARRARPLLLLGGLTASLLACLSTSVDPSRPDDATVTADGSSDEPPDGGAAPDATSDMQVAPGADARSFPRGAYGAACVVDADCWVIPQIQDCYSCCTWELAVQDSPRARAELAAVSQACMGKRIACAVLCPEKIAVCVAGSCALRNAPDAGWSDQLPDAGDGG